MVVLLTGASGFIGRRLAGALIAAGHVVVAASRNPGADTPGQRRIHVDFTRDLDAAAWLPRLTGIDAVINCVGILREHGVQRFEALHFRAPCALFTACARAGVGRVVQVSALGADEHAESEYHLSKRRADLCLAQLGTEYPNLDWTVVQPALVYGPDGTSARLFTRLASLPVIVLPGTGEQQIQPVHVDDLVAAILSLLPRGTAKALTVPLVGPQPVTLREFLGSLRAAMGLPAARFVTSPLPLVRAAAHVAGRIPGALLDPDTLAMLQRGNTGDPGPITRLLGRAPRGVETFVAPDEAPLIRTQAQLGWLLPLLRVSIAAVWLVSGLVSLGLYPREDSYALLERLGASGTMLPVLLYGAAIVDLVIGVLTLALRRRRLLWLIQGALVLLYTALVTWALPEFWLHPFGPILKNLPMLAGIALLYCLEPRP